MELFFPIALIIIFFGSGLGFLMAITDIIESGLNQTKIFRFLLLTASSIIILETGLLAQGTPLKYPITIRFLLTCIYLAGPAGYLYFNSLIHPGRLELNKFRLIIHMMPALIVFISEILMMLQPSEASKIMLANLLNNPAQNSLTLVIVLGALHCFSYFAYLLRTELSVWNSREIRVEIRMLVLANLIILLAVIALCAGFVFKLKALFLSGGVLISFFIHVGNFIAYHRYPQFFQMLKKEIKQKRYEKSLLLGLDADIIHTRLIELMNDEEYYKDMEISLRSLAESLSITPHQLSQFMNEKLNMDFRNFINKYRIEEAKRLLIDKPEKSILNICFEVGFSSKSAFYNAFNKNTGKTPREFRAEAMRNNDLQRQKYYLKPESHSFSKIT